MTHSLNQLPALGIGVSLSLSDEPDPVELVLNPDGPSFIEYAGLVDLEAVIEQVHQIQSAGAATLFHPAYLNFCGSFPNSNIWLEETARHIKQTGSAWLAQDLAYCFWEQGHGYSTQLGYFLPPVFNQANLQTAIDRVREVQAVIPVPLAVEPPPMTFYAGSMPLLGFFGELAEATDCALLLDMGHLVSYEMASGNQISDELHLLPCDRVIELHIAGGRLATLTTETEPVYVDAHEQPILEQSWQMLNRLLPELPNLKAVCFECEGSNQKTVLTTLEKISRVVGNLSPSLSLLEQLKSSHPS